MKSYEGDADHVYVVTLSGKLSGSYNSAELGKNLFEEEHPGEKKIYVFNSRSASVGETLIGMKVQECEEAGMSFEEVVAATEKYISSRICKEPENCASLCSRNTFCEDLSEWQVNL